MSGRSSAPLLRFTITLLSSSYDAATGDGQAAEWPPEPYRLFAALRAGAAALSHAQGAEAERRAVQALRALSSTPPPTVWASDAGFMKYSTFVPVIPDSRSRKTPPLDTEKMGMRVKAEFFPEITTSRALRFQQGAIPDRAVIAFDVVRDGLSDDDIAALSEAAAEVCYFGRSTSPAVIHVGVAEGDPQGLSAWDPTAGDDAESAGEAQFMTWHDGLLDGLDVKHAALVRDQPMPGRAYAPLCGYSRRGAERPRWIAFEPHDDLPYRAVLKAQREFTALGRELAGTIDVEFVVIPNVGNKFANGRLAVGALLRDGTQVAALSRVLGDRGWGHASVGRWLQRRTWTRAASTFATATPALLGTSSRAEAERTISGLLERECRGSGPIDQLVIGRQPLLRGVELISSARAWHVAVRFAAPALDVDKPRWLHGDTGLLLPLDDSERT